MEANDFGWALLQLKLGLRVGRSHWDGVWLDLQRPHDYSRMSRPYISIKTACVGREPWVASHADMLAEDWILVT